MNKFRQLFLLCAVLVAVTMTSCSKDDDKGPSASAMLTSGTWTLASTVEDGEVYDAEGDYFTITFKSNGTYIMSMTFEEDEYTDQGTWELVRDNKYIELDGEELEIRKLDNSNLHIRDSEQYEMRFKK